jgi:hypothetical protein
LSGSGIATETFQKSEPGPEPQKIITVPQHCGSGSVFPGSRIPNPYFRELFNNFLCKKYFPRSVMEKNQDSKETFRIRNTAKLCYLNVLNPLDTNLEAVLTAASHCRQIIHQKFPLRAPMLPLRGGDARLPLLEESAGEVAGPTGEFRPLEDLLDQMPAIDDDHRRPTDENGEDVAMFFGQVGEGLAQVLHVEVGEGAEEGDTGRTRRVLFGTNRGLV